MIMIIDIIYIIFTQRLSEILRETWLLSHVTKRHKE